MKIMLIVFLVVFLAVSSSCQSDNMPNKNTKHSSDQTISQTEDAALQRDRVRSEHHKLVVSALNERMYDMIDAEKPLFPVCDYNGLAEYLVPEYLEELPMDPMNIKNYTYVAIPDGYSFYLGYWRESDGIDYREGFVTNSEENNAVLDELFTKAFPSNPFS